MKKGGSPFGLNENPLAHWDVVVASDKGNIEVRSSSVLLETVELLHVNVKPQSIDLYGSAVKFVGDDLSQSRGHVLLMFFKLAGM